MPTIPLELLDPYDDKPVIQAAFAARTATNLSLSTLDMPAAVRELQVSLHKEGGHVWIGHNKKGTMKEKLLAAKQGALHLLMRESLSTRDQEHASGPKIRSLLATKFQSGHVAGRHVGPAAAPE